MDIKKKIFSQKVYAQCPKCGNWCLGETGNVVERVINGAEAGKEAAATLNADSKNTFVKGIKQTISEMILEPISSAYNLATNSVAQFRCSCGCIWHDDGLDNEHFTKQVDEFYEQIKDCESIQVEEYYKHLRTAFQYNHAFEQSSPEKHLVQHYNKCQELQDLFIANFVNIPDYLRRFIWLTDSIVYYPQNYIMLSRKDAREISTQFIGGLRANQLYIKHPYKEIYYPQEDYSFELLKDEIEEFNLVMAMLGAKEISSVISEKSKHNTNQDNNNTVQVEISKDVVNVSGNYNHAETFEQKITELKKQEENHKFGISNNRERRRPYLKEFPWYDATESWKRDAERVLSYNEYSIDFTISTEREISSTRNELEKIAAEYKELTASVKANLESSEKTAFDDVYSKIWRIHVEFYTLKELKPKTEGFLKRLWNMLFHRK